MRVNAYLDVEIVAHETEDELSLLMEIEAPEPSGERTERPAGTFVVVLDRSGSMGGGRLAGAKTALSTVVDRLDPSDNFGVVTFDHEVEVVVPAGPLRDKAAVKRAIEGVTCRGSTDLSAGYLRGLQEARSVAGPTGATLLVVSDGHANVGITEAGALGAIAAGAREQNVTTSALGYGLGYDEAIMSALAREGLGNELFAEEPDTAAQLIVGEVDNLLDLVAQAASVLIRPSERVRAVRLLNELPSSAGPNGVRAELGGFYADERRKLLVVLEIPAIGALGLAEVATLEFTWVEIPTLKEHTVTVPVHVNVVPGDEAAGRIPDPVVRTEVAYLRTQQAKRRASAFLSQGDTQAALREIGAAQALNDAARAQAPAELVDDLAEEAEALEYLQREIQRGQISRAAKYSSQDSAMKAGNSGQSGYQSRPSYRRKKDEDQQ
ncbi:Ca-activated chloride channel family protein [Actinomadura pelletieri DSM 43383]|uniref:Ca-activated chloride channel family protein n=1 Tax=Actinomadura pelletieri DSM 43383 TaxID=1120940 RepID=A0A495QZJ4_9ACTN|nr:VWA domain-containing protein [Actinomadura pelletieri]RKS79623.1 Ca-activated chloride channel family protein [Actinomadura pelletieri DSM 43383]